MTTTEDWEWGQLRFELCCENPPCDHWLAHELRELGNISEIIGVSIGKETDMFLLENGIAPFQKFYMYLTVHYSKDYSPSGCGKPPPLGGGCRAPVNCCTYTVVF